MVKKWKKILWIVFGYCLVLVFYVNGKKYLSLYEITFRTWVSSSASMILGIFPFALGLGILVSLYRSQKAKNPLKTLAIFQGGLVVYCVLTLVATLVVIARTLFVAPDETRMLDGNYEVRTPNFMHEDLVSYCEPCTPFARKEISMDDARNTNLLELKYQTKFAPRIESGATYYVSEKYPEVKANITNYYPLQDTYLSGVTSVLLREGEKTLARAIDREEEREENGDITYYYVCESEEQADYFSMQLAELIAFALEEPLYQKELGGVNCRLKEGSNVQDLTFYFGGDMETIGTEYGQKVKQNGGISKQEKAESIAFTLKATYQELTSFDQNQDTSYQEKQEVSEEEVMSEQQVYPEEEWLADSYLLIYEKDFEENGYSYEWERTAKGELYLSLGKREKEIEGELVTIRNTLVYDRESKNGECYLVAFYEEHYDAEGNRMDNTSFLDYYAVVKSTGEVIASGKRGWGDLGKEEFRKASGE